MGPKRSDRVLEPDLRGLFCEQAHKPQAFNEGLGPEAHLVLDDLERPGLKVPEAQTIAQVPVQDVANPKATDGVPVGLNDAIDRPVQSRPEAAVDIPIVTKTGSVLGSCSCPGRYQMVS